MGTSNNDYIHGTDGADSLDGLGGNDTIEALDNDDTLTGGTGNDLLYGDGGNDVYVFNAGDGQDWILDYATSSTEEDEIRLGVGIAPDDVTVQFSDSLTNLILTFADSSDRITIEEALQDPSTRIERVVFEDGTVWTHADMVSFANTISEGDDDFVGSDGDDSIEGLGGNDKLRGSVGADTLVGGAGNDSMAGDTGNDVYIFNPGDGQDEIFEYDSSGPNTDEIRLGAGISPGDVTVSHVYIDEYGDQGILLSFAGGTDSITIWLSYDLAESEIERVAFADGTVWSFGDLMRMAFPATEGDDSIYGHSGDDSLDGLDGDDRLLGFRGDDTLTGGLGNDLLAGGTGSDIYVFNIGDGHDRIYDWDEDYNYDNVASNDVDEIRFGAGIFAADVTVSHDNLNSNFVLSLVGGVDSITIARATDYHVSEIERVTFEDGTVWTHADMVSFVNLSTDGDNFILGTVGNDSLEGLGGNDTLIGFHGDDTLKGGSGNDSLEGGTGSDIYLFSVGDGQDTITDHDYDFESTSIDEIRFGEGMAATDVTVALDGFGYNLVLSLPGGTDSITIQSWTSYQPNHIERVAFADGTVWTHSDLFAFVNTPTEGDDMLSGTDAADSLDGLGGNDIIRGQSGADTLTGGAGNDSLEGGLGSVEIQRELMSAAQA